MNLTKCGAAVRHLRLGLGLTVQAMASRIGCTENSLQKIEANRSDTSNNVIHKTCELAGISKTAFWELHRKLERQEQKA